MKNLNPYPKTFQIAKVYESIQKGHILRPFSGIAPTKMNIYIYIYIYVLYIYRWANGIYKYIQYFIRYKTTRTKDYYSESK